MSFSAKKFADPPKQKFYAIHIIVDFAFFNNFIKLLQISSPKSFRLVLTKPNRGQKLW